MNAKTAVNMAAASSSPFITQNRNENSACCFGDGKRGLTTKSDKHNHSISELAEELNELSVEQREKIFDEIHGVSKAYDETTKFVESCIEKLNEQLLTIPQRRRQALDRALFLKPSIASDVKFKLMFLRADCYNASKAARRMSQYFADKLELFGEEKLAKRITLDDLSDDDMKVMNTGFFIVLENKDSSGRPIWFCDLPKYDFEHPASMMRCTWYQIMSTLEDEAAQLKGVANIANCPHDWKLGMSIAKFASVAGWAGAISNNLPCVSTAHHYCARESGGMELIESVIRKAAGKHLRLRSRGHFGSVVETQYELMTFGIQFPDFLFTNSPCVTGPAKEYFEAYIQRRRVKDRQAMDEERKQALASGVSLYPNQNDVLVGRGVPYQNYNGNKRLGRIIEESYLERYRKVTDRFEKTCIHMEVIKEIQDGGGQFVETTPGGWVVVEEEAARSKIWSAFRSKLTKKKPPPGASDLSNRGGGSAKRMRYN